MRMLIAGMDHGELDALRMELNGQHLRLPPELNLPS